MKGIALTLVAAVAAIPVLAQTGAAPAGTSLNDRMINNPLAAWNIYGPNQTSKVLDRDGPQGYPATRVTVSAKGANAWDTGSIVPMTKPIAAGDVVYIAVFLRAPNAKDGEIVPMPFIGLTSSKPPYVNIAGDRAGITNQWAQYYALGTAGQAFPAGGTQATVHLAGDKHVIDIGPIRVFDFGPGYDASRLPRNK